MFDILGAYNGKPPSPGKGGFPFSRILGGPCDFGNRWDCADVLAARALCDVGTPWDYPQTMGQGPRAAWEFVGTAARCWRWGPRRCWVSVGLQWAE